MTPAQQIIQAAKIELARRNFWYFCLYYDEPFFTKRNFLKEVADAFQQIADGKALNISISMPPRSGKSYMFSLFFAWTLGKNPEGSVMRNCCTATLYNKFSYDTRAIVRSQKFRDIFPDVELADDKQNLAGWSLKQSKQVGYFGAGVGGTIIGFGASKLAGTDDLYKDMMDALSDMVTASTDQWKQSAHDSRLESGCPNIDMGTRWSKKDIIGKGIESGKYDLSIVIPAFKKIKDEKGNEIEVSFCEDVKTTSEYLKIRADLIAANAIEIWLAEYMQEPAEVEGLLFRKSDIKRFTMEEFVHQSMNKNGDSLIETILGYIDPAEGGGDPLAFPLGKIISDKVFITHAIFTTDGVETSEQRCAAIINENDANYVRVEKNGLGSGFIRDMRKLVPSEKILSVSNATHKGTRIWNESGFIIKHFYFLAESEYVPGGDYDKFMRNLFSYMKIGDNQIDGAPDACAGLSRFIQSMIAF